MGDGVIDTCGVADRDPWLADEGGFSRSNDRERIAEIIQYIKDNDVTLTLVDGGRGISQQSLLINTTDDSLQIAKPSEWGDAIDSFRVFFRDMQQRWNFFMATGLMDKTSNLSVAMPDALYFLQRRSCNRVKLPAGTRALVKRENEAMTTIFVRDLSADGMLMCNDPAEGKYATDSVISDIVVSIPRGRAVDEVSTARRVLPLIGRGRVVRSFVDQETLRPCYGVSFHYDSEYVKETINQVVFEVERAGLLEDCSAPN
ncbi:MAG: hypothetical protein ABFS18_10840 [Thermodesulfobacteriota bacterium]